MSIPELSQRYPKGFEIGSIVERSQETIFSYFVQDIHFFFIQVKLCYLYKTSRKLTFSAFSFVTSKYIN